MVLDWSINLMGFPRVQVESDSTLIVSWIKDGLDQFHPCYGLVKTCKEMFKANPHYSIKHVYRECIMVANSLAKFIYDLSLGCCTNF